MKTSAPVGLCASCKHVKVITSARGSRFILCGLARTDERFKKYPALPVLRCPGYEAERAGHNPPEG